MDFREIDPLGPTTAGDITEKQVGEAYGRRFAALLPGTTVWAVLDYICYTEGNSPARELWTQVEATICTDPRQPGDTELLADARYYQHVSEADGETWIEPLTSCRSLSAQMIAWPLWAERMSNAYL